MDTTQTRPAPTAIMALATGYWNSATLLGAVKLGLFDALADNPQTAQQIAAQLNASPRSMEILLDALVGLNLLTKSSAFYALSSDAAAFLVSGRPGYLGDALKWSLDQYAAWGDLDSAVRSGTPAVAPSLHLGDDPEQTRTFVLGMHSRALGMARGVVGFLDLAGAETLLDVGGGPGTYATLLAQKHSNLNVTVLDVPGVVVVARELVANSGVADRIAFRAGDGTRDDYGTNAFDAVLFSGVLHQMSGETIRAMFAKAKTALKPGGRVIVSDVMLEADKARPAFAALFSLQMMLTSEAGAVFSSDECANWLRETGFANVTAQTLPPPLPYVVVTGIG